MHLPEVHFDQQECKYNNLISFASSLNGQKRKNIEGNIFKISNMFLKGRRLVQGPVAQSGLRRRVQSIRMRMPPEPENLGSNPSGPAT